MYRHIPDIDSANIQDDFDNTSQTGNIGTALYVAPELSILGPKAIYNEVSILYRDGHKSVNQIT